MAKQAEIDRIAEGIAIHFFGIDWCNLERNSQFEVTEMARAAHDVYCRQQQKPLSRGSIPHSYRGEGNNDIG